MHCISLRSINPIKRKELLEIFYSEIYQPAFPVIDQTEDPSIWLPLLETTDENCAIVLYILLAVDNTDHILGGIIYEYYEQSQCWLNSYICVRATARNKGVGNYLFKLMIQSIESITNNFLLFAETENSISIDVDSKNKQTERLIILNKLGYSVIDMNYIQPCLSENKRQVDNLSLLFFNPTKLKSIDFQLVLAFLNDLYNVNNQSLAEYISKLNKTTTLIFNVI